MVVFLCVGSVFMPILSTGGRLEMLRIIRGGVTRAIGLSAVVVKLLRTVERVVFLTH